MSTPRSQAKRVVSSPIVSVADPLSPEGALAALVAVGCASVRLAGLCQATLVVGQNFKTAGEVAHRRRWGDCAGRHQCPGCTGRVGGAREFVVDIDIARVCMWHGERQSSPSRGASPSS